MLMFPQPPEHTTVYGETCLANEIMSVVRYLTRSRIVKYLV